MNLLTDAICKIFLLDSLMKARQCMRKLVDNDTETGLLSTDIDAPRNRKQTNKYIGVEGTCYLWTYKFAKNLLNLYFQ